MPKDPTRNIERYKVAGSHLNEFEFHKNQARMAEQFEPATNVSEGRPLTVAEQLALVTAEAHRKAEKRRKKLTKGLESTKTSSSSKTPSRVARGKQKMVARASGKTAASSKTAGKKAASSKTAARKSSKAGSKKAAGK